MKNLSVISKPVLAVALLLSVMVIPPRAATTPLSSAEFYWLLNRACWEGDVIAVEMLLKAGADPLGYSDYEAFHNSHYQKGYEPSWPINQAAQNGHVEIIRMLLDAGAEPDSPEGEGVTALIIAAERGHIACVKLLLQAGADKRYVAYGQADSNRTAEELALQAGYPKIAKFIHNYRDDE